MRLGQVPLSVACLKGRQAARVRRAPAGVLPEQCVLAVATPFAPL